MGRRRYQNQVGEVCRFVERIECQDRFREDSLRYQSSFGEVCRGQQEQLVFGGVVREPWIRQNFDFPREPGHRVGRDLEARFYRFFW